MNKLSCMEMELVKGIGIGMVAGAAIGMLVAPKSSFSDGLFAVVVVARVPSMMIPFLLPLFILGIHIYLPIARVVRAKEVTLRCKGMVVNIDGRLEPMDEAHYRILPGALMVRLPAKK